LASFTWRAARPSDQFAQPNPDPAGQAPPPAAGQEGASPVVVDPTEPGAEISFSGFFAPQSGQGGAGEELRGTIFSKRLPHVAHRYS